MTQNEAQRLCDKIAKNFAKDNAAKDQTIADLKTLRNYFIDIKDPMLTKITRLAYEYIEQHGTFEVEIEDFEPDEEQSTFEYFMELVMNYDNNYNREELQEIKMRLIEQ
ncbi:MAG TPA: hypothetical protein VK177_11815 [Flavobacteriales bacterium]|nr:hypothetical protein [Flavobacteriales bacterium]